MKNLAVIAVIVTLILFSAAVLWQKTQAPAADQLPTFTLTTLDGKSWHSDDHLDKVLIVNFWATWCPPCRREMPLFVDLQHEYAEKDVMFVGIALDGEEPVRTFVENYGIDFPILLGNEESNELAKQLGNKMGGLPYTVIVSKDGTIHKRHIGALEEAHLRPILEQLTER